MKDTLELVNKIHLTLIAVCTAILLFGLSPDKTKTFDAAIEELKALSALDLADLKRYIHGRVDTQFRHIDLKKTAQISFGSSNTLFERVSENIIWSPSRMLPCRFDFPPMTGSLSDIEKYFNQKPSPLVFVPNQKAWKEAFFRLSEKAYQMTSHYYHIDSVALDIPEENENSTKSVFKSNSETVFARLSFKQRAVDSINELDRLVQGAWVEVKDCTAVTWLQQKKTDIYNTIYKNVDGRTSQFPNLMSVWNDVRLLSIEGAIVALHNKKQESRGTMSLFGFTVSNADVNVFAPLVTSLVLLYLLAHVLHLRRNLGEIPAGFPWIALYPGMLSRVLTAGSLIVLPIFANCLVCYRAWAPAAKAAWIGLLLTILTAATGIIIMRELSLIRGKRKSG